MKATSPRCGQSDKRNQAYRSQWSPKKFFTRLIKNPQPVILDVGAHHGESAVFFNKIFPKSCIYSFEPDSSNFPILQNVISKINKKSNLQKKSFAIPLAVAEKNAKMIFYQQSVSHLGGLLAINRKSKDSLGYAKKAPNKSVQVSTTTLDRFCKAQNIKNIDLLKIDCQGYEVEVLKGAKKILGKTACCSIEVSFYDFYKKSTSLLQVSKMMDAAGMELWDISKVSKNPKNLRTDWAEFVYLKSCKIAGKK